MKFIRINRIKMINKNLLIILLTTFLFSSCQKNENKLSNKSSIKLNPHNHKVTVEEVINVSEYTYLKVKENNNEFWIAVPKAEFKEGEVLYFNRSMEMKNFESKELKRTFNSILFVDDIEKKFGEGVLTQPQKPIINKIDVSIEPIKDGVTISKLFSNINFYDGKIVKVKGKVTKINSGIMGKNWVHIQDGTFSNNNFDLTITTNEFVKIGDIVTFEGKIAANKDFGFGYSYKLLMENAKPLKNL